MKHTILICALGAVALFLTADVSATVVASQQRTEKEGDSGHKYPVTVEAITTKAADAARAKALKEAAEKAKSGADGTDGEGTPKEAAAKIAKPVAKTLDLLGLGIREKTWVGVNVYSYALFVDRQFVKTELARFKDIKWDKLKKRDDLYRALLNGKTTKELRLRFCRKVDSDDVVSAFEDSLKPRMLTLLKGKKGTDLEKLEPLETFRKLFTLDKLRSGNELRFTWHKDGTLSTVINGKREADIKSPALARALFDVYIGSDPISKTGKKKLTKFLPALLTRHVKAK